MKPKRPKRSPPMLLPASRIEKQKQTSPAGPIRKTAYETPAPPYGEIENGKKTPSVSAIFFRAAFFALLSILCRQ
jgi:hypothetical protein